MPIEIKELHIKAVLSNEGGQGTPSPSSSGGAPKQEAIVAACVAQVLDILKQKAER